MTPLRQRYREDLQIRNYAERTVTTYTAAVAEFAKHFNRSPAHLDAEHIRQYQLHLIDQQFSWSKFNQTVCALRLLYAITLDRPGMVVMIPFGKKPRKLPAVLSKDEVARVLAAAVDYRFGVLLQTTYGCGLRISEVTRLRIKDIDSPRMALHIRCSKGRKDRLVPLSRLLLQRLRDYWRRHRPSDWLFPGAKAGCCISTGQVQRLCRMTMRAAGITKQASMHTLRHSYATHLLEAGTNLPTLQKLLGHNQVSTTLMYIHLEQDHLLRTICPLDSLPDSPAVEDSLWTIPPLTSGPSCAAGANRPAHARR
jgi:integrase/recombinase XerD